MCNSLSHSIFQDFVHIIIVSKNLKYNLSKLANLSITPPFQIPPDENEKLNSNTIYKRIIIYV